MHNCERCRDPPSNHLGVASSLCPTALSPGYAKMIVVDLAFLFEGYNELTLPEQVLGTVRLKNAEFGKKLRFVEAFDE